jgi:hypothetical protein
MPKYVVYVDQYGEANVLVLSTGGVYKLHSSYPGSSGLREAAHVAELLNEEASA